LTAPAAAVGTTAAVVLADQQAWETDFKNLRHRKTRQNRSSGGFLF
jgi:hypothetical protein